MAIKHTISYLKSTSNGIIRNTEERKLTRATAIKFKCLDCSSGMTTEVTRCSIEDCPLWVFRPYQKSILS